MSGAPPRKSSDLTIPIPREALPPPRSVRDLMGAAYGHDDYETLDACPACRHCPHCLGAHAVSPERAVEIREALARDAGGKA